MHLFKQFWVLGLRRVRDEYRDTQEDLVRTGFVLRLVIFVASIYLLLTIVLGIYWSFSYPRVELRARIATALVEQGIAPNHELAKGVATTVSLFSISEALWEKPGGYLANDIWPPGLWLDNMPSWEFGVVQEARYMIQMLRVSFSQSSINNNTDEDLQRAQVRLNFDNNSWFFPATESQYLAGVEHLQKYMRRLTQTNNSDAHFYTDAQHLNDYLAGVEQRLKGMSQRLTASIGPKLNADIEPLFSSGESRIGVYKKTPWLVLDNVFYEARGSSWALITLLKGVEIDFKDVLLEKNARDSYAQIIRELEPTQQNIYSPFILNGNGFGFVANHSLVMASYIARTQAAIADCRRLLLKTSNTPPSL
jgi:hypothetical protein